MKSIKAKKVLTLSAWCLIFLTVAFSEASAQTAKRKLRRAAKPTATRAVLTIPPASVSGEAEIVSRAGEEAIVLPSGNRVLIVPENQPSSAPETLETKLEKASGSIKELKSRVKSLEGSKQNAYDEKQKRLALNLDILTKAEGRAESLRKQMFDMAEKEGNIKMRLDQLEADARPETIDRAVAFTGTLRPEELREQRRKSMESERANLQNLLTQVQSSRASLDANVQKADALVEKLRFKLEKDIDDALTEEVKEDN